MKDFYNYWLGVLIFSMIYILLWYFKYEPNYYVKLYNDILSLNDGLPFYIWVIFFFYNLIFGLTYLVVSRFKLGHNFIIILKK